LLFPAILLARFGQRLGLFRPEGRDDVIGQFDFKGFSNASLRAVLEVEATLLERLDFPVGVGLMCVARK
jgi:hypothetical protein